MKKQLVVTIMFLLAACICFASDCFAVERDELGRCLDGYFENVDFNNDGLFEVVKITSTCRIFTNVPDSVWEGDLKVVVEILDEAGESIFREKIEQFLDIDNVEIIDGSKEGFKQVFLSGTNMHSLKWEKYSFGFKDGKYQMIKDWNKNVR